MALILKTISDSKAAQQDLRKLESTVEGIKTSVDSASARIRSFALGLSSVIAAGVAIKGLTNLSDEFANLRNQIASVTNTQEQAERGFADISKIAINTRNNLSGVAKLYSRIAINSEALGINQKDTARLTDIVSKSLKVSGASAQEASSSLQQLGQAIGSGNLAGDELKSILENNAALAKIIAKGLGVQVGDLKAMGEAGAISVTKLLKGLLNQGEAVDAQFNKLSITYGDAFMNLGTSLKLLMDAASRSFFGTSNAISTWINNLAKSIFSIATNFEWSFYKAKAYVAFFVFDTIELFKSLWKNAEEALEKVSDIGKSLYESWKPSLDRVYDYMLGWAAATASLALSAFESIKNVFSKSNFVQGLIKQLSGLSETVSNVFYKLLGFFNIKLPTIDVSKFFKGLEPMLNFIRTWARKIEGYFFWLYDRVIGNSWIPDLVTGVTTWFSKLKGQPLNSVKSFTNLSELSFKRLTQAVIGSFALSPVFKFLRVVGLIGAAVLGVSYAFKKLGFTDGGLVVKEQLTTKTTSLWKGLVDRLSKLQKDFKGTFDKSVVGRTLKQMLGMPDRTPGSIFGTTIDTNAKVGRGPQRNYDQRTFGHDVFNTLPQKWQLPVLASITGLFALGIMKAVDAGPVRSVLLSALTTVFALAAPRLVNPSTISGTMYGIANTFVDIIAGAFTKLLDGNVAKDPLGLISLIAKTSILFKSGREYLLELGKGIVTAPTKAALAVSDVLNRNFLQKKLTVADRDIQQLPNKLLQNLNDNNRLLASSINRLSVQKDSRGQTLGQQGARSIIASRDTTGLNESARLMALAAIKTNDAADKSRAAIANSGKIVGDLKVDRDALAKRVETLSTKINEGRERLKQGIINTSAGVGGAVGGIAGLQIGNDIAKGMKDSPEWQKLGVTISVAIVGQLLGAGIGTAASTAILFAFSKGSALFAFAFSKVGSLLVTGLVKAMALTNPWVVGAGIVFGAIYLGYELFKRIPDEWYKYLPKSWRAQNVEVVEPGSEKAKAGVYNAETVAAANNAAISGLKTTIKTSLESGFESVLNKIAPGSFPIATDPHEQITARKGAESPKLESVLVKHFKERELAQNKFLDDLKDVFKVSYERLLGKNKPLPDVPPTANQLYPYLYPPVKKASGGIIKGPGGPKDDKVPALLSNGEFVVNTKQTKANRGILEMINNGKLSPKYLVDYLGNTDRAEYDVLEFSNAYKHIKSLQSQVPQVKLIESNVSDLTGQRTLGTYKPWNGELEVATKAESLPDLYATYLHELGHAFHFIKDLGISPNTWKTDLQIAFERLRLGTLDVETYANRFAITNQKNFSGDKRFNQGLMAYQRQLNEDSLGDILSSPNYTDALDIGDDGQLNKSTRKTDYVKSLMKRKVPPPGMFERFKDFILNRATGGLISGPGGPKDDKIPAMLSNGEYVINAEATRNNLATLEAINGGKIAKFQSGGQVGTKFMGPPEPTITDALSVNNLLKKLEETFGVKVPESVKDFFKNITKSLSAKSPTVPTGSTDERGNFRRQLDSSKSTEETASAITAALGDVGAKVSKDALKSISPSIAREIADGIDIVKRYDKEAASNGDTFAGRFAKSEADKGRALLGELLSKNAVKFEADSKFTDKPKNDDKPLTLADQFDIITKTFPALDLSLEEFRLATDEVRESIFKRANSIFRKSNSIDDKLIGVPGSEFPVKVASERAAVEGERKGAFPIVSDDIANLRTPFQSIKSDLEKFGLSLNEDVFNIVATVEGFNIRDALSSLKNAFAIIKAPKSEGVSSEARAEAQVAVTSILEDVRNAADQALVKASLSTAKLSYKSVSTVLQGIGVSLDKSIFDSMPNIEREVMRSLLKSIADASYIVDTTSDDNLRLAASNTIASATGKLNGFIKDKSAEARSKEVGRGFASDFYDNVSSNFSSLLKSQSSEGKSPWKTFVDNILDRFTNTVIDTFSKGLMSSLMGEGTGIFEAMTGLGSGIASLGQIGSETRPAYVRMDSGKMPFGTVDEPLGDANKDLNNPLTKVMDFAKNPIGGIKNLFKDFKFDDILKPLKDIGKDIMKMFDFDFSSIFKFFGFGAKDGGKISGAGTGRSDSIPTMLSNGEYVINAAATSRFLPLLDSINNGRLPHFKDGGLVSQTVIESGMVKQEKSSNNSYSLSFTGDISRQTKQEVFRMIPELAGAIDGYRRERNIR